MIYRIDAIAGFEGHLAGVDRVRQRIGEIEKKFGIGGVQGQDFQAILNKELDKIQGQLKNPTVTKTEKAAKVVKAQQAEKVETNKEIETFGVDTSDKSTKVNSEKTNTSTSSNVNRSSSSNTLPGEEALPSSINEAINPFAAAASRSVKQQPERVDEEFVETPTRETKRLSFDSNMSTEDMIAAAAEKYDVDPRLVKAVAIAESNMNQNDISDAGAIGVMQLMPETARGLGVDPYDEQQNIEGGAKYLKQMLDTFGGNVKKAIAAYNAGPGAVQKYGGIPPYGETQHYVGRVMDLYR